VLALVIIGGVVWLLARGVEKDPALVGALLTAGSAVVAVTAGRSLDRRAESKRLHREQMAPLYAELIERLQTADQDSEEAAAFWTDLSRRLIRT
jgi:hypothetical protein